MSLSPPPPAPSAEARSPRRRLRRTGRTTRRMPSGPGMSHARTARKLSLVFLFLVAQALFLFSPLFRLSEVVVRGNERLADGAVVKQAAMAPGSYLWALSPHGIGQRIQALREVRSASVSMAVPGRVTLEVRERQPVALVSRSGGPCPWYEVDAEGVVLGSARPGTALPRVRVEHPVPAGGRIDPTPILLALKARTWVERNLPAAAGSYEVDDTQAVSVSTLFLETPMVCLLYTSRCV